MAKGFKPHHPTPTKTSEYDLNDHRVHNGHVQGSGHQNSRTRRNSRYERYPLISRKDANEQPLRNGNSPASEESAKSEQLLPITCRNLSTRPKVNELFQYHFTYLETSIYLN